MNLTLRTLLAYLDDTLPAAEVRAIRKQVEESPIAKELAERITKVTRQRRLMVPSDTGPDATDPNIVASYLDNQLDPDRVIAYEQKCLTSDVHLAEVASAHQILSLIGQKAKVPPEARERMYGLIKGREAIAPQVRRGPREARPEPVAEPAGPWGSAAPPRRPWFERFGPLTLGVVLMAVLCWSAWMSLKAPPPTTETVAQSAPAAAEPAAAPPAPGAAVPKAAPAPAAAEVKKAPGQPGAGPEAPKAQPTAPEPPPAPGPVAAPPPNLPAGSAGVVAKTTGVLLRSSADPLAPGGRQWERVEPKAALRSPDRLLNLQPFRTTLELGTTRVELVGESEVGILPPTPARSARLELVQGRVVVRGPDSGAPVEVQFRGRALLFTPPPGALVGLERQNTRAAGEPSTAAPALRVFVPEGEVGVKAGAAEETLAGPAAITFRPPDRWTDRSTDTPPAWVTNPEPTPFDATAGDDFLRFFRPGRPLVTVLVEALDDESQDVRRLAIAALRAMGDISFVVPKLSEKDAPATRRAAIAALRDYLAQGPDAAQALRRALADFFGAEQAQRVEKLLVGYTPKEAKDEATYEALVQQLASTDDTLVGVRELALDNLEALTGRDDLGYNPDKPEGKGLKAWRDLLKDHELHPPAAPKAKK